jgi:hypothetical protein
MHKLSEREKEWSQEAVKRCMKNGKVSSSLLKTMKLVEEYKKKFNKNISTSGLYNRLYRMNPSYRPRGTNAAEISNYLVFIKVTGQIAGFETEEEVKAFIETNQVIGNNNIRIFKHIPVNVEYKVKIG